MNIQELIKKANYMGWKLLAATIFLVVSTTIAIWYSMPQKQPALSSAVLVIFRLLWACVICCNLYLTSVFFNNRIVFLKAYLFHSFRDIKLIHDYIEYYNLKTKKQLEHHPSRVFHYYFAYFVVAFQTQDNDTYLRYLEQAKLFIPNSGVYSAEENMKYCYLMSLFYFRSNNLKGLQKMLDQFQEWYDKTPWYAFRKRKQYASSYRKMMLYCYLSGDTNVPVSKEFIDELIRNRKTQIFWDDFYLSGLAYLKIGETEKGYSDLKRAAENGGEFWDAKEARKLLDQNHIAYEIQEQQFNCSIWEEYPKLERKQLITGMLAVLISFLFWGWTYL